MTYDDPDAVLPIDLAQLRGVATLYRYDKTLDEAADLFDRDPRAWQQLPVIVQDRSGFYRDLRDAYRRAVKAGVIPDDRGPDDGPIAA